ncbi:2-amino-4-hydroxy-6-hydroxymethyldihydropteridine diphosphokinase [Laceyella putida]|uniref:2-amino-4-hydroxy-6-hydroxymethyldihydropteridine diphosphokinase n=1 Tax=Laceyella putida TaxID=110101 RepID=A0ABW2RQL5_9BACL
MSRRVTAYLGLGANMGDRLAQLSQAISLLDRTQGISVQRISSVYETAPVGLLEQPHFYNLVVEIHTTLIPTELLRVALAIEKRLHRVRLVRWGPRTIDIDLLLYDDRVIRREELEIPHPRMHERAFVLIPLEELVGNIIIPGTNTSLEQWIAQLPADQEINKLDEVVFPMMERNGV